MEYPIEVSEIPEEQRPAGTLVHFQDGEKMLIGHCNEELGWCNCCNHHGSLVVKLETVWKP